MFASRASTGVCIGPLTSLLGALPAAALTQKECSEKYQVAKAAGTLGDKSWSDFRKECAANGATTTTAPDTKPAAAEEPEKKALSVEVSGETCPIQCRVSKCRIIQVRKTVGREGPSAHVPRSVQCQQGHECQRWLEVDHEGRRVLQRVQQAA
jgi:hypothetical protein